MQQLVIASTEEHMAWELRIVDRESQKPVNTYMDRLGRISNANPMFADAYGQFGQMFLPVGKYRLIFLSPDGKRGRTDDVDVPFIQVVL